MKRMFTLASLLAATLLSQAASAGEMTLYAREGFRGSEVTVYETTSNFRDLGFNDRASSLVVHSGAWELCEHRDFGGYCAVFERGEYADLRRFNNSISSAREVQVRNRDRWGGGGGWNDNRGRDDRGHDHDWRGRDRDRDRDRDRQQLAPVELFTDSRFEGPSVSVRSNVRTLVDLNFNDRVSSLIISEGQWELCEHADYRGECVVYGPGRYPNVGGMNDRFSSIRRVR
ncbi:beta/gamma crystallin family protein [Massilia sp. MB5]|uniref:beta/gamma crystallin-related protein n=1 Tax=Massilia sp. MB5 TaxID=2919578 RepID=UPI001F1019D6|nr:beta/gamma crystallin-related protein [Massilia sp. MB5]UMR33129.1 beta/gamma crystallin family protein [Massilia sp. MB5]